MFSHYPKLPLLQFGYKAWSSWLLILRTVNFPLIHKYRRDGVSFFFFDKTWERWSVLAGAKGLHASCLSSKP
jgi:hypothetical protein